MEVCVSSLYSGSLLPSFLPSAKHPHLADHLRSLKLMLKGNIGAVTTMIQLGMGSWGRKDSITSACMKLSVWISPLVQSASPDKFFGHQPALPSPVKDVDRHGAEGALQVGSLAFLYFIYRPLPM